MTIKPVPFVVSFVCAITGEKASRLCLSAAIAHRLAAKVARAGVKAVTIVAAE